MSSQVSLPSTRFKVEMCQPSRCDSVTCLLPQSRFDSGVRGHPVLLWPGSSSMVLSDADVEGAVCKEERTQCHQAEGSPPTSSSPTLP